MVEWKEAILGVEKKRKEKNRKKEAFEALMGLSLAGRRGGAE
jgi:hypothetical protein